MLGMHGTVYANYAVNEADLLIALGVRFDDRVTGEGAQRSTAKHGGVLSPAAGSQKEIPFLKFSAASNPLCVQSAVLCWAWERGISPALCAPGN